MNKKQFLGVAYYPEAWDRSQIDEDLDKMVEHGISCVRIAEFAWKTMEPTEGNFDFSLFREVVDKCKERNIMVIMGTPGATPPLWLSEKYPDIYGKRFNGKEIWHGARQDCCYNHEEYLRLATRITEKMAIEFADDENIIGWQIDNEISSAKDTFFCVCEKCERAYRRWLRERFNDDVEKYNREVGCGVFSTRIDSFEQIHRPRDIWTHPGVRVLWRKFQLDSSTKYVKLQYDAIKRHTSKPVGTDMMPTLQALSYEDMSQMTDIMQFNQYHRDWYYYRQVFWSNYIYNAKNQPYWLTETSCCWNGSARSEYMRHRGFVEMNGWMHLANGAASVNYWLWRTHYAGHELMHGSVIESNGRSRHIKDEVKKFSADIDRCAELINDTHPVGSGLYVLASTHADATFDAQAMYGDFKYMKRVEEEFLALSNARLRPSAICETADLSSARVLYTPYTISLEHYGLAERILEWVRAGGTWVASPMTDIRTANEAKYIRRATSVLEDAADITIDYTLPAYHPDAVDFRAYDVKYADGRVGASEPFMYDAIIPGEGAESLAKYTDDEYLAGATAITSTKYGKGRIVVIGFIPTFETLIDIMTRVCADAGITPFAEASNNVTLVKREGAFDAVIAIEHEFAEGEMIAPFDCVDMLSGDSYKKDERIAIGKYGVKVLKSAK